MAVVGKDSGPGITPASKSQTSSQPERTRLGKGELGGRTVIVEHDSPDDVPIFPRPKESPSESPSASGHKADSSGSDLSSRKASISSAESDEIAFPRAKDSVSGDEAMERKARATADQLSNAPEELRRFVDDNKHQMPPNLGDDLARVCDYCDEGMVKDFALMEELAKKLDDGKELSNDELWKLNGLMRSCKHNVGLLQGWLSVKHDNLRQAGAMNEATMTALVGVSNRLADIHMGLADVMSRCGDFLPDSDPVSRKDKLAHNAVQAKGVLRAAGDLKGHVDIPDADHQRIMDVLKAHSDKLDRMLTLEDSGQTFSEADVSVDAVDDLPLETGELWEDDIPLSKHADKGAVREFRGKLQEMDQAQASGASDNDWMPAVPRGMSQRFMLNEFVGHQLKKAGVPDDQMPDLKFMAQQGTLQELNDRGWDVVDNKVQFSLDGASHDFRSVITPGKHVSDKHLSDDQKYGSNGYCSGDRLLQYKHAPNMAHTELFDEGGNRLFSAVRHGVIDPYRLQPKNIRKLSDQQVSTMVDDLLVKTGRLERDGLSPEERTVDSVVARLRTDKTFAASMCEKMRDESSALMAKELLSATLVTNPQKKAAALENPGAAVPMDINSICLLTPDALRHKFGDGGGGDERALLTRQSNALQSLDGKEITLTIKDDQGNPQDVKVLPRIRTVNFGVNGGGVGRMYGIPADMPGWRSLMGWGFSSELNNPALTDLLGPANRPLGGKAQQELDRIDARLAVLQQDSPGEAAGAGAVSGGTPDLDRDQEIANLTAKREQISVLTTQIKDIWKNKTFWSSGNEPYKMVSRLAVLSNLISDATMFNCKSGKDRTGEEDNSAKYLAAYASLRGGAVAPPDVRPTSESRSMKTAFVFETGNHEMQAYNTGLPGYKLQGVPALFRQMEEGVVPHYFGGSKYVSS